MSDTCVLANVSITEIFVHIISLFPLPTAEFVTVRSKSTAAALSMMHLSSVQVVFTWTACVDAVHYFERGI